MFVLAAGVSFGAAAVLAGPTAHLMARAGLVRCNVAGRTIPTAVGAVVPLAFGAGLGVLLLSESVRPEVVLASMAGIWAAALAGLVDDVAGRDEPKGWVGHGRALVRGACTAGLWKALAGTMAALLSTWAVRGGGAADWLGRSALVALAANAANSLDTRPGRAILGLAWAAAALGAVAGVGATALAWPALGAAAGLWAGEQRQQFMLGDSGALALGFAGGFVWAAAAPWPWVVALSVALAALVIIGDRYSLGGSAARVGARGGKR